MPEETRAHRRPRSVFLSAGIEEHENVSDVVWELTGNPDIPDSFGSHVSGIVCKTWSDGANRPRSGNTSPVQVERKSAWLPASTDACDAMFAFEDPLQDLQGKCADNDLPKCAETVLSGNSGSNEVPASVPNSASSELWKATGRPCPLMLPQVESLDTSTSLWDTLVSGKPQVESASSQVRDKMPKLELVFGTTSHVFNKYAEWVKSQNNCSSNDTTARKDAGAMASNMLPDPEAETSRNNSRAVQAGLASSTLLDSEAETSRNMSGAVQAGDKKVSAPSWEKVQ